MSAEPLDAPRSAKPPMSFTHLPPAPLDDRAQHVMVPMRDGVRLATDVYLPATEGPVPVVLTRSPYDKCGPIIRTDVFAAALTARGYAFVAQDVRGKFRSEGATVPFATEAQDGYDTIDWIVRQPWSSGRVGMTGISYLGYTQWAALSTQHPALRAIAPRSTNTSLGAVQLTPGEPEWSFPFQYVMDFYAANDLYERDAEYDWSRRPLIHSFEEAVEHLGFRPPAMEAYLAERPVLHRYPEGHPLDAKPIPVLLSLGWFDPYCPPEAMRDYQAMMSNPTWRPLVHLRLAPHDHDDARLDDRSVDPTRTTEHEAPVGGIDVPQLTPEQILAWFEGELAFFDRYLKGDADAAAPPPVEYQLTHSGEVRHATAWPPPEAAQQVLYLTPAQDGNTGGLQAQPVEEGQTVSWTHDPDHPVPSVAHFWSMLVTEHPDFRATADHPDVLAFRAAAQEQPLELAGPVTLHARVQTTGPAMDLFAYLLDLEPDGAARYVARGQRRLAAAEPTEVAMSVGNAGYVLRPGHTLMLLLCSSDYPDFLPLTGTVQRYWYATTMKATTQTLQLGGAGGARIELTVR